MTDRANLVLNVDSRQVKTGQKNLKGLEKQGARTEKATDQLGQAFRRIAGPIAVFLSTRQIIQAADAWTGLTNRLKIVTDSSEELAAAQSAVFAIAQESRQPLQTVAEVYQRLATNQDALGLSGERVAGVVDTISKAIAISGTSAAAAQGALTQLGQGFASGTLRGQELNSVLEQAPALAKAIADGLGVAVGDLRKLGESGTLTANAVVDALEAQADSVDEAFGEMKSTVAQSFTVLGNSLTKTVGVLDSATGASSDFAESIIDLAEYLDSGDFTDGILESMALWRLSIDATIDALDDTGDSLAVLGEAGSDTVDFIIDAFKQLPVNVVALMQIVGTEIADTFARGEARAKLFKDSIVAVFTDDTVDQALDRFNEKMSLLDEARVESIGLILQERDAVLELAAAETKGRQAARAEQERLRKEREERLSVIRADAASKLGTSGGGGPSKEELKAIEKLEQLRTRTVDGLKEEIALFGMTTEAAKLRYETENGSLAGLNELQKIRIIQLAEELDALGAQAEFAEKVQGIISESMPDAEREIQGLQENILTLKVALDEGSISIEQYAESVGHINEKIAQVKEDNDEFSQQLNDLGAEIDDSLLTGISNAIGGVEDWEKMFLASIAKILIQLAALKLQQSGMTLFDGAEGGGSAGILKNLFSFDGGGDTGIGSRSGGVDGKGGFPAILHPNEKVIDLTKGQSSNTTMGNVSFIFPGVKDRETAKKAGGDAARKFNQLVGASRRYN